jgi:hypothetical protein
MCYINTTIINRPNLLINTMVFENTQLTAVMLCRKTAEYLCKTSIEMGLNNSHAISMIAQTCSSGSSGQNSTAQERIFEAYQNLDNKHIRFDAHVGLFFIRKSNLNGFDSEHSENNTTSSKFIKSATKAATVLGNHDQLNKIEVIKNTITNKAHERSEQESAEIAWNATQVNWSVDATTTNSHSGTCSQLDTFVRKSLLLSGPDRIFRICMAISPAENLGRAHGETHWCMSCHLNKTRHHHCPVIGGLPSNASGPLLPQEERVNLTKFVLEGEARKFSDSEENGRPLPEVVQWCHGTTRGLGGENYNWVDVALMVRLARSSTEHSVVVRYLESNIRMLTSVVGKRSQLKLTQVCVKKEKESDNYVVGHSVLESGVLLCFSTHLLCRC